MKAKYGLPLARRLLSGVLPPHCRLCGAAVRQELPLCEDCRRDLPRIRHACRQCAAQLTGPVLADLCGHCQQNPPAFTATTAALHYRPPVDYLVQRLKFSGELALAPLLAALLSEQLGMHEPPLPECLIPVPLHQSRLRERGFNQAMEIARVLGRRLELPVDRRLCRRIRQTGTQSLLPVNSRRRNVRNAFALNSTPRARHVAIVDDVMTSGHTTGELARVLKRAGIEVIEVWVIARAGH